MKEYRHTEKNPCHISAGGVIFKKNNNKIKVIVLGRHLNDGDHYHLPKGTLKHNETIENCAKREVLEESGYETKIIDLLSSRTDAYIDKHGINTEKTVIYFAMEEISHTDIHDHEHDFVVELDIDDAIAKMKQTEPEKEEFLVLERLKSIL